eukprot:231110_1
MANIRDLGDTSHESVEPIPNPNAQLQQAMIQQQQPQPDGQRQQEGGINKSELQQPFMMGAGGEGAEGGIYKHPPITKVFAPNFTPKSFIFIISIIQIVVFIGELIVGQIWFCGAFVSGNGMAGPSSTCFKWIGAKYLPCIQNGQVWRFFTSSLLHSGILHILTNLVPQTMIGYTCELHWNHARMAAFYFATAFGATLASCVGSPDSISVGASGALLGIIGAYMAWLLLNWNNRAILPYPCPAMCTTVTWSLILCQGAISMPGIDNLAHVGGWLSGVMLGLAFNTASMPVSWMASKVKCIQMAFAGLSVACFLTLFVYTFFNFVVGSYGECRGDLPTCY